MGKQVQRKIRNFLHVFTKYELCSLHLMVLLLTSWSWPCPEVLSSLWRATNRKSVGKLGNVGVTGHVELFLEIFLIQLIFIYPSFHTNNTWLKHFIHQYLSQNHNLIVKISRIFPHCDIQLMDQQTRRKPEWVLVKGWTEKYMDVPPFHFLSTWIFQRRSLLHGPNSQTGVTCTLTTVYIDLLRPSYGQCMGCYGKFKGFSPFTGKLPVTFCKFPKTWTLIMWHYLI